MAHCTNKNYRPRKYGFGGGIAIGGILGGYLGYKIGRARPQKYGFDTENKIGKGIKKTFSKKKKRMRYGGKTRGYFNNDPRVIRARFNTLCAETGKPIKKGQECVYYPSSKQCFSLDSKQAQEFREYMSDLDMGYNYAKGGEVAGYINTEYDDEDKTEKIVLYDDKGNSKGSFKTEKQAISYAKKIGLNPEMYAKGGKAENEKHLVFADGSKFIVKITDKPYKNKSKTTPELVRVTQQDRTTSILKGEKSLAQKSLDEAEKKNMDFPTLLVVLKKAGVFKKIYAKGGSTYAVKPHADHREQDEFWKEMNSDSYAEDGGISDSRQRVAELLVSMDYDNGFYDEELDRNGVSVDDAIDWELNNRVKSDKDAQYYIEKYEIAKGGSTYYNGGGINDFEIGDKVMYDSYRDGTREGEILREIDDNHFEIGSDFGVSMVHKDKIIGYAPKRMFGLFEQGGNIDDIVAG
jgi:hypothetical protein